MNKALLIVLLAIIFVATATTSTEDFLAEAIAEIIEEADTDIGASALVAAVAAELSFARTKPKEYAKLVAAYKTPSNIKNYPATEIKETVDFLNSAKPCGPLALNDKLSAAAASWASQQGPTGTIGHGDFVARINRFGKWSGAVGECISYGYNMARDIVVQWLVDYNVAGKGHRKNIFNCAYKVAGVGFYAHKTYNFMCVLDLAGGFQ